MTSRHELYGTKPRLFLPVPIGLGSEALRLFFLALPELGRSRSV
jgi:hypothetical protein